MSDKSISTLELSSVANKLLNCLDEKVNRGVIGDSSQKVESLKGWWFNKSNNNEASVDDSIKRNHIIIHDNEYFRVLCVFTKTYKQMEIS